MIKTFSDICDTNIVQQTSCEPLFPDAQMQLKMYFFVSFVRPCMHHNYGVISQSHACGYCVWWPIILDAELYTTYPRDRDGLNEREAPGKVVTARPPKRLAQLLSISHALVSTLQKHQTSKRQKVKNVKTDTFGSLHFRDNWGGL